MIREGIVNKLGRFLTVAGLFLCTGCARVEEVTGTPMTDYGRVTYERNKQNAEIAKQQAEILGLYKDCLVRSQTDKSVDCSQFRTALQVIEVRH